MNDEAEQPAATSVDGGVGPWRGVWPTGDHFDPELLVSGDHRNVVDRYRYWRHDAIVADLDTRRHAFHVAIENWQHDFNIGSVVRTANAFLAAGVHIVGKRRWNRRGAMVTDRYQHLQYHSTVEAFAEWSAQFALPIVGVDNIAGSTALESTRLPTSCVLVLGQEGPGLTEEMAAACSEVVSITQYGSTRSLNAGAAAAIVMHAWVREHVVAGKTVARGDATGDTEEKQADHNGGAAHLQSRHFDGD